jgi:hypothetical protein
LSGKTKVEDNRAVGTEDPGRATADRISRTAEPRKIFGRPALLRLVAADIQWPAGPVAAMALTAAVAVAVPPFQSAGGPGGW